jgi:hypothetical protein
MVVAFQKLKQSGADMYKVFPVFLILLAVAACAPETQSRGGYFDTLTPDPSAFERRQQENRLIEAEINAAEATTADAPPSGEDQAGDVLAGNDPAISRTQDFSVITQQETIESDAARLRALAEDYQVIQPEPLPERTNEVNLAAYAINQTNQVGNKIYIRNSGGDSRCFAYREPDEAQRVFLASGGPKRDPRNLDIDGDGFACKWTPDAYRSLVR